MNDNHIVSVIVPFFNAEKKINNCILSLEAQTIKKENLEIIFIDDCSEDSSKDIIKKSNLNNYKIFSLQNNSGPASARNLGLQHAVGDYVFFLDADDTILNNSLLKLHNEALKGNYDLVFCDKSRINNSVNSRENIFAFKKNKEFLNKDITGEIIKRITDPDYTVGVAGCHGKLIKKQLVRENNIKFEEKLRFLEDEIFMIDILGVSKKIKYLKEQLYVYNINPETPTGRSNAFNYRFPISNFKLMRDHITTALSRRSLDKKNIIIYGNQALIYYIIYTLISYTLSILRGKIDFDTGIKKRKKIINDIIDDHEITKVSKDYKKSKNESFWIPKAIQFRSKKFLEIFCNFRAKSLLRKLNIQKNN